MQLGLPDMGAVLVDQRDACLVPAAKLITQAGGEFESAGSTADNDDLVSGLFHCCIQGCFACKGVPAIGGPTMPCRIGLFTATLTESS
jgi:hypothetical protein